MRCGPSVAYPLITDSAPALAMGEDPQSDTLEVARTAGFTTLVLAQLFNAFNSRSETTSAFNQMFVNGWLWFDELRTVVLRPLSTPSSIGTCLSGP